MRRRFELEVRSVELGPRGLGLARLVPRLLGSYLARSATSKPSSDELRAQHPSLSWIGAMLIGGLCAGFFGPAVAHAMPDNSRQVPEGYWVGGQPEAGDVRDLYDQGIRVILSAVVLDLDTRRACRRRGIERVNVWFGNNFPDSDEILQGLEGYKPSQIFIHCRHGGDRAGALLAFLLVAQQGWRPDRALLSVVFPRERDVDGLIRLLEDSGAVVTAAEISKYTGAFSGVSNGGTGGLKIRGPDYRNLVRTMLAACQSVGVMLEEPDPEPATVISDPPPPAVPVLPANESAPVEALEATTRQVL